jgi:hypothetical protein
VIDICIRQDYRDHRVFTLPETYRMNQLSKAALLMIAVCLVAVALVSGYVGTQVGVTQQINIFCCQLPPFRSLVVSAKEILWA